jgi:hypothetical protein
LRRVALGYATDLQHGEHHAQPNEHAGDGAVQEKLHLATSIATALVQHTTIEQQVVYPWARDYIVDADAMILEAIGPAGDIRRSTCRS